MKEARFISRNKDKWKNMENGQQLDAEHLAANFIELSDDLAYARTFYPGSEVERYLNQLIAGYQTDINSRPVRKNKPIWYFWKQELPLLLASEYKTLLFAFFFCFLNLWWLLSNRILRYIRSRGYNFKRVVIVGAGTSGISLYNELQSDAGYGFRFLGFFDNDISFEKSVPQFRGNIGAVGEFCIDNQVDEIYCALPDKEKAEIIDLLYFSEQNGIRFFILPEISQYIPRRLHYQIMGNMPLLSICKEPLQRWTGRCVKRLFDFLLSLFITLSAPIWYLPIAFMVKLSSPGPILFRQKRTGYMGKEFNCLKFRTMRINVDADKLQATANDPRITRIGHFLRKTSLDELPQIFNILRGDMSLSLIHI